MLKSLRKHGVKYAAIVSGDLEQPTRKLAESLQFDEYYAGVVIEHLNETDAALTNGFAESDLRYSVDYAITNSVQGVDPDGAAGGWPRALPRRQGLALPHPAAG